MIVVRHERWAIAIVSCILGFMVVTQYKMTQDNIEENMKVGNYETIESKRSNNCGKNSIRL